jgi:hypothetical protein
VKVRATAHAACWASWSKKLRPRYFYRRRFGNVLASFVEKRLPSIHIAPCKVCADYHERKEATLDATSFAGEQESQARKLSRKRSLSAASG